MPRWHTCNILQTGDDARRLWQFDARNGQFSLSRAQTPQPGEALNPNFIQQSWRSLWQPRLNVAWLPAGSVFLRVVHLPPGSFEETLSMVELQLEKLSPIPVTQAVWTLQPLPQTFNGLQTLIVVLAERKAVEEFLGRLEGQGFLADRLELPLLDQLQATAVNEDGAWIYPGAAGDTHTAIIAWWYGGALQSLNFISLPSAGDPAAALREELSHILWSGEMDGWLATPPTWHLVADAAAAQEWESPLREALAQPVELTLPMAAGELAALTAKRATHANPKSNLLPPEFSTRYRQQFVDRLWLRGLGAVGAVYAVLVAIYFVALGVQNFRVSRAEVRVKAQSQTYTNAMQLTSRYNVLKERQELKFASLDCWKSVAEMMPVSLGLDRFTLTDGRRLTLSGSAPADGGPQIIDFVEQMRKATSNGQPLFDTSKDNQLRNQLNPGGNTRTWSFVLDLKRTEAR